jgi:hypothetical protein
MGIVDFNNVVIYASTSKGRLAMKATDYGAVIVGDLPGSPVADRAFVWQILPFFSSSMGFIGLGIRSGLYGTWLAQRGPADGGGVGLVSGYEADLTETWQINPANSNHFMPFTTGPTYGTAVHCDLTIKGSAPWKAGDQVITWHWNGNVENQLWAVWGVR